MMWTHCVFHLIGAATGRPQPYFCMKMIQARKMINNSVCSKSYRSMTDEERALRELQQQLWIYFGLDGDRPF